MEEGRAHQSLHPSGPPEGNSGARRALRGRSRSTWPAQQHQQHRARQRQSFCRRKAAQPSVLPLLGPPPSHRPGPSWPRVPSLRKQIPPTFLPLSLLPSSTLQRAPGARRGERSVFAVWPAPLESPSLPRGRPGSERVPSGAWAGGGGSLYLSWYCLMYTYPLYLLPNKRNTSVLPTEIARAQASPSPGAWRQSRELRVAEFGTVGTPDTSEVPVYRSMGVRGGVLAGSVSLSLMT